MAARTRLEQWLSVDIFTRMRDTFSGTNPSIKNDRELTTAGRQRINSFFRVSLVLLVLFSVVSPETINHIHINNYVCVGKHTCLHACIYACIHSNNKNQRKRGHDLERGLYGKVARKV